MNPAREDAGDEIPPKVAAIRAYTAAGFALIPLRGKIPTIRNWAGTQVGAYGERELAGINYGVVLRDEHLVVDIDPRNFPPGDKVLARFLEITGPLKSFTVRTGGGGGHIYFRKPPSVCIVNSLKDFPGIEFKSAGRQVVGAGSTHPDSGKQYETATGDITEMTDAPAALLSIIEKIPPANAPTETEHYSSNDDMTRGRFSAYLTDAANVSVEGALGDNNAFKVAAVGRDLGLPPEATLELMLSSWNERCSPPWGVDELKIKVANAYKFAKKPAGSSHPAVDFVVAPRAEMDFSRVNWVLTTQGKIVRCLKNCVNYLRAPDGGLKGVFAYNEFTGRIEFANPAPWHKGRLPKFLGVSDHDLDLLRGYLAHRHGYNTEEKDLTAAITNAAYHDRFHPVREYLNGLVWDGKPRLNTWLADYLGAIDGGHPEYLAAVSRKTLCGAVMRVMRPGIKFDHVLVLEGRQDIGKSAVCEILGGEWYSDAPIDPHSRDTVDAMQGRWIIEIAEMEVVRKADEDALKAFITRRSDRVRLAYGRTTGEFPRQSIFIATKNPHADNTYLKDPTGNRRWWPVWCEPRPTGGGIPQVDFKGLKAARNQLFAEAVALCKSKPGEELFMDSSELKDQAKVIVGQRHAEHEWTERIASWIEECDKTGETKKDFLTARDVFINAMGGIDSQFNRRASTAISSVLRNLGWIPTVKRPADRLVRGWARVGVGKESVDNLIAGL